MKTLEELKESLANMRYGSSYHKLNPSQQGCIDWELEYDLEVETVYFNYGVRI